MAFLGLLYTRRLPAVEARVAAAPGDCWKAWCGREGHNYNYRYTYNYTRIVRIPVPVPVPGTRYGY